MEWVTSCSAWMYGVMGGGSAAHGLGSGWIGVAGLGGVQDQEAPLRKHIGLDMGLSRNRNRAPS